MAGRKLLRERNKIVRIKVNRPGEDTGFIIERAREPGMVEKIAHALVLPIVAGVVTGLILLWIG